MRASSDHAVWPLILDVPVRLLRAVAVVLFADPFALMVAGAGGWLTTITLLSLGRLVAAGVGGGVGHVVGCTVYLAALGMITALALAHILITGLAGWSASIPADSGRAASAGRPAPGRDS